jgi:hypothetical protein
VTVPPDCYIKANETVSCVERKGKERKGKERKGKERKGKERGKVSSRPTRTDFHKKEEEKERKGIDIQYMSNKGGF